MDDQLFISCINTYNYSSSHPAPPPEDVEEEKKNS
jgi:hypothetical protein